MKRDLDAPQNTTTGTPQELGLRGTLATTLLEEGAAFQQLTADGFATDAAGPNGGGMAEEFDVIVIGGGQAGLSVGYHLSRTNQRFVILDDRDRVGDAWRDRWDSLELFSTARFDGLDGMPFPGPTDRFPTKDEMGDYLESYAKHFRLPVRNRSRVERLTREGDHYVVLAGGRRLAARQVVVAMSSYQTPRVPEFARDLAPSIVQMHSTEYRRPAQLPAGDVLVVGAGNSGAEIAMDLLRSGRNVRLSGRIPGQVPFDVKKKWVRNYILPIVFRFVFHRVLTVDTPMGRKARPDFVAKGTPLIRTRAQDLAAAGVARVGRTVGVQDGRPVLDDGTVLNVSAVVWCTGFAHGQDWNSLPVFDDHGDPMQVRGAAQGEPGLYFVGSHFLFSASSAMVHGVGRDAQRVAVSVAARTPAVAA